MSSFTKIIWLILAKFMFNIIHDQLKQFKFNLVGVPRIELGLHPPHGRVMPLYHTPFYRYLPVTDC